jgi:2-hydroxy-3-oxopropionate reductase
MGEKVGFIGLGIMGMPMAKNLQKAGYETIVYDIFEKAVEEMVALGSQAAATPKEVAQKSDFVVTMLPDVPHVKAVCLGKDGIIEGAHEGLIVIDSSTTDPDSTRKIHDELLTKGVRMIDAPVMGIQANAEQGSLIMTVGGSNEDVEACRGILETVGARVVHAGPVGAGKMLKITNNLMQGTFLSMVSEAIALTRKNGVDTEVFLELFKGNLNRNLEYASFKIIANNFDPLFTTSLMLKDMRLGLETSGRNGAATPLASVAKDLMQMTANNGFDGKDCTSVFTTYEDRDKN